ncbi:MAG: universal stress protein [Myxococcota bacterium]
MIKWDDVGTIIVPVDLDEPEAHSLRVAIEARPEVLHVVYVLPELEPSLLTQIDPVRRQESAMASLQRWLADQGAPEAIRPHIRIGVPGHVVPEMAGELGADLVVMSSHGRTGIPRALMGSVAERLVRFSPCPVLVLKSGATDPRVG